MMVIDDTTDHSISTSSNQQLWVGRSTFVENFDDHFDFDSLIHNGQFADTYKYRLKGRETLRAVKAIAKTGHRKTPPILASIVLQLDHPNIVVAREIFETSTHIHIVQDFVDGPNLFQRIAQRETFTEIDLSNYASHLLKALEYIHEKSIYHGNIHGGNVLVRLNDQNETVCLGDFAFSNLCTQEARTRLVQNSPILCAPEILRGESFSAHSDCWQLGLLLYFCCTGRYPFQGKSKQLFQTILKAAVEFDSLEWDDVSFNGQSFIGDLLNLDTKKRMKVNQALTNPWIKSRVYRSESLSHAQENIRSIWIESTGIDEE